MAAGRKRPRRGRTRRHTRRCAHRPCGRSFLPAGRGRPQRYCTPACRNAAYRERGGPKHRRLVRLLQADARRLLPTLPAGAADLIVTDPPYVFDRGGTYFRTWFPELADAEWPAVFRELHRVLASPGHAYVFCDARIKPIFDAAAAGAGFQVRIPLIWDKLALGLGATWRSQYESIAWYAKGPPLARGTDHTHVGNVLRAPRVRGYPAEKPVAILRTLIMQSSRPGDLVLDPFCGSGNVGRAARRLGRRALLADIDPTTAEQRLRVSALRPDIAS
ncbi:MAG: DNA methyltransferase [Solirubrobacteraceae bacterium]